MGKYEDITNKQAIATYSGYTVYRIDGCYVLDAPHTKFITDEKIEIVLTDRYEVFIISETLCDKWDQI